MCRGFKSLLRYHQERTIVFRGCLLSECEDLRYRADDNHFAATLVAGVNFDSIDTAAAPIDNPTEKF